MPVLTAGPNMLDVAAAEGPPIIKEPADPAGSPCRKSDQPKLFKTEAASGGLRYPGIPVDAWARAGPATPGSRKFAKPW